MLPRIQPGASLKKEYQAYLTALKCTAFQGEIRTDYAARISLATDNSIYQIIPEAILFPKSTADIALIFKIANQKAFRSIQFVPRGGGTGANGQSLNSGIVIDCSKYMNRIIEINVKERWVRVEPGVILDQLNEALKSHDYYFAPQVSTSSRATIGGMVNTDACGNGSRLLGRTRDHVLELTLISAEGNILQAKNKKNPSELEPIEQEIYQLLKAQQANIQNVFKNVPRNLNGYNLLGALDSQNDTFNLNALLCGSEGTLAVVTECKLALTPIPRFKKMVVIQYPNFEAALRAEEITADIVPNIIETLDEKLVALAREDYTYFLLKNMLDAVHQDTKSINLVEFSAQDEKNRRTKS